VLCLVATNFINSLAKVFGPDPVSFINDMYQNIYQKIVRLTVEKIVYSLQAVDYLFYCQSCKDLTLQRSGHEISSYKIRLL
jgi:hypothetical protein